MCRISMKFFSHKGYIFDFNGTMFFDGAKHDKAWRMFLEEQLGRPVSRDEFFRYAYGRTGDEILQHFMGKTYNREQRSEIAAEKERLYRKLCLEEPESLHLAAGLPEYLTALKERGARLAVSTAANRENMEFYFEQFHLENWFSWDVIVYDNGTLKGKPEPDFYLAAMQRIKLAPSACHIFEDSVTGIQAASRAGAGMITAVYGDSSKTLLEEQAIADQYIEDYKELLP